MITVNLHYDMTLLQKDYNTVGETTYDIIRIIIKFYDFTMIELQVNYVSYLNTDQYKLCSIP